jgi:hypothetical protein
MTDEERQYVTGTSAATLNILALIVDEMHRRGVLDRAGLLQRVEQLSTALADAPDRSEPFRDQTIVAQLRLFLRLASYEGKPDWTPVVIQGGNPEHQE